MNTISSIIHTLSDEEKRVFISMLKKKNKRADTKNIQLFTLLNSEANIKNPDRRLYGKPSKNAYHALSKRLHDTLIDFIASKSLESETSEEMSILKLLLASRIFFEQKQYKVAFRTIHKAEVRAESLDLFSILNEIYYTQIQHAHLDQSAQLEVLIQKFRINQNKLRQEENLNLFYATIQKRLQDNPMNIEKSIQSTLETFDISVKDDLTFRSLFKLLEITNTIANVARNFYSLLPFVETTYKQIESKDQLSKKHLYYHIQILYYVANSYFRNRDFENSMKYLGLMMDQMQQQNHRYHKRFLPQYTLVMALNLNYTGEWKKAIMLLDTFDYHDYRGEITYVLDLKLIQIVFHFQQSDFSKAWRLFQEFYHSDTWYTNKAGRIWVIKKNLIEILLHIELDHMDLVESRLKSFRKKHNSYLKNNKESRVLIFLSLVTTYYYKNEQIKSNDFTNIIENSLLQNSKEQEDIFDMSFYAWLKSRIHKTDIYETTLQLVRRN